MLDIDSLRHLSMGALTGTRVLDLGLLVQGPQSAAALADLGADVIKIELPGFGDQARWIPVTLTDPRPPFFLACNRGKRSVTIDLRTPEGKEVFLRLADEADVIISNFKPGTLDEWGLSYEEMSARNPRLVYATGSVLGPNGPEAALEGADLAGQAASGLVMTTGTTDGEPGPVGFTISDHVASLNMTIGILTALLVRETSGRGQRVDVSLVGSQLWSQASELTAYFLTGEQAAPADRGHPYLPAIYGIFPTSDGWIACIGVPPAAKQGFCEALGSPELMEHPAMQGFAMNAQEKREVFALLNDIFITNTSQYWLQHLRAHGQRVAPVNDYAAVAADPHNTINGYLHDIEHPEYGPMKIVVTPIELSDTPLEPSATAPELGQDTELVLIEAGYDWAAIGALRESGAI